MSSRPSDLRAAMVWLSLSAVVACATGNDGGDSDTGGNAPGSRLAASTGGMGGDGGAATSATSTGGSGGSSASATGGDATGGGGAAPTCVDEGSACATENPCVEQAAIACIDSTPACQPVVHHAAGTPCGSGTCDGTGLCRIYAEDANLNDWFGQAVAIEDDTVFVASARHDAGAFSAGAVFALTRHVTDQTWVHDGWLVSTDPQQLEAFGHVIDVSGPYAVVGDPDDSDSVSGAAYVLERIGAQWQHVTKLTANVPVQFDEFGGGVAIDGDRIAVGARGQDDDRGAVHIYERSGTTWVFIAEVTASDALSGDGFGADVALAGDTLVVGAPWRDDGAVYVYDEASPGAWTETIRLMPTNAANNATMGISVDIDGDIVVAGAPNDMGTFTDSGAAYVFERIGNTWTQTAKLAGSDTYTDDLFGLVVDAGGGMVIVGAPWHDQSRGAAYVFWKTSGGWSELTKLSPSDVAMDDHFGRDVAMSRSGVAAIGAHSDDGAIQGQGSVLTWAR